MLRIAVFALAIALLTAPQHSPAQDSGASESVPAQSAAPADPAAAADADPAAMQRRLVGEWVETAASRNHVDFFADGRVSLYLKKGEIGELRSLDGTWTLTGTNALTVQFTVNQQSITQSATLSFEGEEMLLTDEANNVTRHRRREGALPEEYRW
jgi:uncharacterized protein (TIGR03066 family)